VVQKPEYELTSVRFKYAERGEVAYGEADSS